MIDQIDVPEWMVEKAKLVWATRCSMEMDGATNVDWGQMLAEAIAAHPEFVAMREKAEALDAIRLGEWSLSYEEPEDMPGYWSCNDRDGTGSTPLEAVSTAKVYYAAIQRARQEPTTGE